MPLQNYLHASRSLAKLASLGDIRESNANEHIVSKLLDIACNSDSTADQIYIAALGAIAPSNQMVSVQGGKLPRTSEIARTKVEDFQIGMYAVIMGDWQGVRSWAIENGFDMTEGRAGGPSHPVTWINWYDCVKWCNAKSEMEGLEPVYGVEGEKGVFEGEEGVFCSGEFVDNRSTLITWVENTNGYRLPQVSEWEWAARGGNNSKGYAFAGANNLNEVGWYESNSEGRVREVGLKTPNELGLFDMSGNAQERCWDINGNDITEAITLWVRGGSSLTPEDDCKVSTLIWACSPVKGGKDLGFRIARSL